MDTPCIYIFDPVLIVITGASDEGPVPSFAGIWLGVEGVLSTTCILLDGLRRGGYALVSQVNLASPCTTITSHTFARADLRVSPCACNRNGVSRGGAYHDMCPRTAPRVRSRIKDSIPRGKVDDLGGTSGSDTFLSQCR